MDCMQMMQFISTSNVGFPDSIDILSINYKNKFFKCEKSTKIILILNLNDNDIFQSNKKNIEHSSMVDHLTLSA